MKIANNALSVKIGGGVIPLIILRNGINIMLSPSNIISLFAACRQVVWIQNFDPFVRVEEES